jgi:thiol-disulfide isomerase/thioredoxin
MRVLSLLLVLVLSQVLVLDARTSLQLTDVNGRRFSLDEYRGRIVLIDAWATWCAPCLVELPRLRRLEREHTPRLAVIGLSVDRMARRDFVSWLRRKDVTWRQHFDGRGYESPAARQLAIDAIPDTWLFDEGGRLVARGLRGQALEDSVIRLMAQPAASTGPTHGGSRR